MRTPSNNWNEVYNGGSYKLITQITINNIVYDYATSPIIDRQTMPTAFSVGHCCCSSLELSVKEKAGYTINKGDTVTVNVRLDGTDVWVEYGTFFIDTCKRDHNGIIAIIAYDAIMKAEQDYYTLLQENGQSLTYPATSVAVYEAIRLSLGVSRHTGTFNVLTGNNVSIPELTGNTARETLSMLAGYYGGNFYITEANELKLLRFVDPPTYNSQTETWNSDITASFVLGNLEHDDEITLTKVVGSTTNANGESSYFESQGDDSGFILNIGDLPINTQASITALGTLLNGKKYVPFKVTDVVLNPGFEIGDTINIHGIILGVIYNAKVTLDSCLILDITCESVGSAVFDNSYKTPTGKLGEKAEELDAAIKRSQSILQESINGLSSRITSNTSAITKTTSGSAQLYDFDNDGKADTLVISQNPATGNTNWNTGRVIRMNYNGLGFSTNGISGPFTDFAIAYDTTLNKYVINASDIKTGTISGVRCEICAGTIGGWIIDTNRIYDNSVTNKIVGMNKHYSGMAFFAGADSNDLAGNQAVFRVDHSGNLTALSAEITGTINAESGEIGGWTISSDKLIIQKTLDDGKDIEVSLSTDAYAPASAGENPRYRPVFGLKYDDDWKFYVRSNGQLFAKNAIISGSITASSGEISGNLSISGSLIHARDKYSVTLRGVQSNVTEGILYIFEYANSDRTGNPDCPFRVNGNGSIYGTKAVFQNLKIEKAVYIKDSDSDSNPYQKVVQYLPNASDTYYMRFSPDITCRFTTQTKIDYLVVPEIMESTKVHGSVKVGGDDYDYACGITTNFKNGSNKSESHVMLGRDEDGRTVLVGYNGNTMTSATTTNLILRGNNVKLGSTSGATVTSDERLKESFISLDKYDGFFDALIPCAFKYKNGSSGRFHIGFKAQDVEQALLDNNLSTNDFGGFVRESIEVGSEAYNGYNDECGLRYNEFIGLLVFEIQKLKQEVRELKGA